MRAFRYDSAGAIVPCDDMGFVFREVNDYASRHLRPRLPTSKRERRQFARMRSGRGRRHARKIGPVVALREQMRAAALPFTVYRGHRFADGRIGVRLYLPEGVAVADADVARLDRAIKVSP